MHSLKKQLNIKYPICNAGMAFVASPELASAVSLAGGLGFIGAGIMPPKILEDTIVETQRLTQGKPFGIDFIVPFFQQEHLLLALKHKPAVVAFFYGIPSKDWLTKLYEAGIQVWITVNSIDDTERAVHLKPNALIVQGSEAGGHVKAELPTNALFSSIHAQYPEIKKLWAGGISSGAKVRQAILAGASGVWCGTVFLASLEANAHEEYKDAVVKAKFDDTVVSTAFGPEWPDEPMRVYCNTAVKALYGKASHPDIEQIGMSYIGDQIVPMPKYSCILPMKDTVGHIDLMALTMGSVSAEIDSVRSVKEIMLELTTGLNYA